MVGPPTLAMSSKNELLAAVLERLELRFLRLGIPGELENQSCVRRLCNVGRSFGCEGDGIGRDHAVERVEARQSGTGEEKQNRVRQGKAKADERYNINTDPLLTLSSAESPLSFLLRV